MSLNRLFTQIPGRLKVHPAECVLRISVNSPQASARCNILALNDIQSACGANLLSLCLVAIENDHSALVTAVDVSDAVTYQKKLTAMLARALSSADAQHFAELRGGRWSKIDVEHGAHIAPDIPAFKLIIDKHPCAVFSQMMLCAAERDDVHEYSLDVLAMPLGDLVAAAFSKHIQKYAD